MIVATAGHIDHGKTALVQALTGIDADRLPEEKRRGLTIDLGFAYTTLSDGTELGFVDVPGHERFLPNMLAGMLGLDRVLLIVAADDGPRPQTHEHLEILALIGIAELTAIVTKIDRVGEARRREVADRVRALVAEAGFAGSPVFALSSRTGEGIDALRAHLSAMAVEAARARAASTAGSDAGFRLPIDRAFSLPGIGLVVTGTIAAGEIATGDRLCVSPIGLAARVRALHAHNHPIERAAAGERCAVNLVGPFPDGAAPGRGDWLVAPELHRPVGRIDVRLRVARSAPAPLRDGLPVHLHLGTADRVARVAILGARTLAAGESGFVQLDFEPPIGALWGDRAVLRDHAARHTLAGGIVVDPFPPRRGRARPERLALLEALAETAPQRALARLLTLGGSVVLAPFALARNLTPAALSAALPGEEVVSVGATGAAVAVTGAHLAEWGDRLVAVLAEWHRKEADTLGPGRAALFRELRGKTPEPVLDAALARLVASGRVVREGALLRLSEHRPRLARADAQLWERVQPLLASGGLRPPRVRELAEALGLEPDSLARTLKRLARFGLVAPVADNRVFLPETIARLAAIARELAAAAGEGGFTAIAFRDRSGVGRNLTIEILEYLDAVGVTRRVGDGRIALPQGEAPFA